MIGIDRRCDCPYPSIRPRGALARALYNKQVADHNLAHINQSQWYSVTESAVDPQVKELFLRLDVDQETEEFLLQSSEKSDNLLLQIFYSAVKLILSLFMTQTSINGFLGRGSMFVWSESQFERLTGLSKIDVGTDRTLLDLGAGDGSVTRIMEPFFHSVHVTELSKTMKSRLISKGFRVVDEGALEVGAYDAVSCLNVLDRCDKPKSMLESMKRCLKPGGGLAFVAVVLPFQPYVETGRGDKRQSEDLCIAGTTLEEQVNSLVTQVFPLAGFKVLRWTRLPYLCEGDLSQSFYWLDDVAFILSPTEPNTCPLTSENICTCLIKPSNRSISDDGNYINCC